MTKTLVGPGGTSTILYSYDDNDRLLREVETVTVAGAVERKRAYYAAGGIPAPTKGGYYASRSLLAVTGLVLLWPVVLLLPRRPRVGKRVRRRRVVAQTVALFLLPVELVDPSDAQRLHYSAHVYAVEGDVANAGVTTTPTAYTYDDNGNTKTRSKNNLTDIYTWDFRNRLVEAANRIVNASKVTIHYDVDGLRVIKDVQNESRTEFLVDKNHEYAQVVQESASSDVQTGVNSYVYGDNLISITGSHFGTRYYSFDGQMSTRQLTSFSGGITDDYAYDSSGLQLHNNGTTPNAYRYNSEQNDATLGFQYLRARYYVANLGRFLSLDSHEGKTSDPMTLHKYLYARANPVHYRDPSGTSFYSVLLIFIVCFIAGLVISSFLTKDIGRMIENLRRELQAQSGDPFVDAVRALRLVPLFIMLALVIAFIVIYVPLAQLCGFSGLLAIVFNLLALFESFIEFIYTVDPVTADRLTEFFRSIWRRS